MRDFCRACNRTIAACFCAISIPFASAVEFALIVHPDEVRSTVGTAWIMRRSISNIRWVRSKGIGLDTDETFLAILNQADIVPLLLFPGPQAFNLSRASTPQWNDLVPPSKRPVFIVLDGTWFQAHAMLRRSKLLRALPRVSFEMSDASEYGFKKQPHPTCLSSVEGVHRVIELLGAKSWSPLPERREHDVMIEIFRQMVVFQTSHGRNPRSDIRVTRRNTDLV